MISFLFAKIKIHPIFWLIMAAGAITGHFWEMAIAFFIVLVHECGHGFAAYKLGWHISRIQLLPFGGVAEVEHAGDRPMREEWIVVLAGPLQHLWLPLVSFALSFTPFWSAENQRLFLNYNAMIFFFNLFPIWPLDGGKMLQLILLKIYPFKKACEMALTLSMAMLILLTVIMITFFSFSLNFFLIGLFLAATIYKEWKARSFVFIRFLLACWKKPVQSEKRRTVVVSANLPVAAVFSEFYKDAQHRIVVKGMQRPFVDQSTLIAAFFSGECKGKSIGEFLIWKGT